MFQSSHHDHITTHQTMKLVHIIINIVLYLSITNNIVPILSINNDYYPQERDALIILREALTSKLINLHSLWTGPPCHKNDSNWVGVVCAKAHVVGIVLESYELKGNLSPTTFLNIPYLTKLSFSNNSISGPLPNVTGLVHVESVSFNDNLFWGPIPTEFALLPRLETLELQQNNLYGHIPPFNQPSLTAFNVSGNNLDGPIPDTSVLREFPKSSYDYNSGLCGPPLDNPCEDYSPPPSPVFPGPAPGYDMGKKKAGLKWWGVALVAAAVGLVPFGVMIVWLCHYRVACGRKNVKELHAVMRDVSSSPKSKKDPERGVSLEFFGKEMPVFDLDDLLRSSADILGKGVLGTTYKTTLETGHNLAVKRLKDMNEVSKKEFVQQMQLLGKTCNHENLVKIVSFYYSKDEKLVVYEFVPHGTLFELLHENRGVGRVPLNWETRLSIIKDIANGLKFLHQSLPHHKVPHANIKSTNILIQRTNNNDFRSKLTDFGYLPLLHFHRKSLGQQRKLAITRSPEYAKGKKLSRKADVYCFGVIILEIITGRIPAETSNANEERTEDLSEWVRMVVNTDWSTDILDVEIASAREGHEEMLKLTDIALQCTDVDPGKRPKISEVLQRIEEIEWTQKENDKKQ